MNRLPVSKRAQILAMLCEGNSMRSVSRLADVSINTVSKLLVDAGSLSAAFHAEMVRDVKSKRVQCDEIWSFCYAKRSNVTEEILEKNPDAGDVWTWTALDADAKLIISWHVGGRTTTDAHEFIQDLADRLSGRVQLSTDGLSNYPPAIVAAFGEDVDLGVVLKKFATGGYNPGRYSPPVCVGCENKPVIGNPDPKHISTSYIERSNLTLRMQMRRYTRLTNGFSKKVENHVHMVALYTVFYNWMRKHKTLKTTPAVAAGLTDRVWEMAELVEMMDQAALVPATQPE